MQKKIMKNKGYLVFGLFFLFALLPIISASVTQEYSKIFLSPFYTPQLQKDINYSFSLSINSGGTMEDIFALLTFQLYASSPNQYFYAMVNNQSCNNPYYLVSLSGLSYVMFDCSNVFTHDGDYEVILSSNENSVSSVSWLDFTYSKSIISVKVHGTEYYPLDVAKEFLQLLDGNSLPIGDADCFISIYYPNNTLWKYQQSMAYVDEGIYVYDVVAPEILGVFPVTSYCVINIPEVDSKSVSDDFNSGLINNGIGWSNNWSLGGCSFDGTNKHEGAYSIGCIGSLVSNRTFLSNSTYNSLDYSFWWRGSHIEAGEEVYFEIVDASGTIHRVFTIVNGMDNGAFFQNTGTLYGSVHDFDFDGNLTFRVKTNGVLASGDYYNFDFLNITLNAPEPENITSYQSIRGSGEIHVNRPFNFTQFAEEVWTYDNRSLIFYGDAVNYTLIEDLIVQYSNDETNYSLISDLIIQYANDDTANYTLLQNLIIDYANDDNTNYTLMEYLITEYSNEDMVNYTLINDLIVEYANDDTTNYSMVEYIVNNYAGDNTNYTLMQFLITEYGNEDVANYTLIQDLISQYANDDTINYTLIEQITQLYGNDDVTNYTLIENLLGQYAETDPTNYTLIQELISQYSNDLTAEDIWNYNGTISTNILDSISSSIWNLFNNTYNFASMIGEAVWVFDNRTLSDGEYDKIAKYVWTSDDRNLTFYQVNNISVEDVWSYANRSLTFYPEQEEINYSQVAEYVWLYADRNLTTEYINNMTIEDIWSYYNRSLTQNLPLEIWSYENRNLTTDIPFEVWNYYNRTLTYYAINLTDLIDQINDYEFTDDVIIGGIDVDSLTSNQLNVVLYIEK